MKPPPCTDPERLFTPFFDPIDATLFLPADAPSADISLHTKGRPLRFPLILDPHASLIDHLRSADHTPASFRFGPFCDNLLGMNWILPDGRDVRIGERVVKSTTGYDWFRFLLHTNNRFGRPSAFILRLRPDALHWIEAHFDGDPMAVRSLIPFLLQSGWMHWWDSVDLLLEGARTRCRVVVNCPSHESSLFTQELERVANRTATHLALTYPDSPPMDGLPDFSIKTTADAAPALAQQLTSTSVSTVVSTYCGTILGYSRSPDSIQELLAPLDHQIRSDGGHWSSRHLPSPPPSPAEQAWIQSITHTLDL